MAAAKVTMIAAELLQKRAEPAVFEHANYMKLLQSYRPLN